MVVVMRSIGLDAHRDFCEVAICERGRVRSAGRIATTPEALRLFGESLQAADQVVVEATGNAVGIVRILEPFVERVVLADAKAVRAAARGRAKTDKVDARLLARLLAAGFLGEVWTPDEQTRARRRLVSRRAQLVRQRTREKNQVHAVLMRRLVGKPPMSDLFGVRGRAWLARLELPADERLTVDGCLRHIDMLNEEIGLVEQAIAADALGSPEMRRLLTIPGVNAVTACALIGAIGDIDRFPTPQQLVGYLGLDPRVIQSGSEPGRHGRISKQGPGEARHVLVEAAWHLAGTIGPLRAFHQRIRARRGANVATVAVARKLAVICWHMLTREEDYAFARPSLTREKLRRLELLTGAERNRGRRHPERVFAPRHQHELERELAAQAETAYKRLTADWTARRPKASAGAAKGRASYSQPKPTSPRGRPEPQAPALRPAVTRAHDEGSHP
ncbi:MAG TPA: IS110 family transposase, partial [Burkholderiales bacterium]|nr:IS110 family transposase [Burkholderiales bacterium]